MFNKIETDEGNAEVNTVQDHLCDKRADLYGLEDCGAVVEEVAVTQLALFEGPHDRSHEILT